MEKLGGFLKLIRFELPFSAGVCVLLGQALAVGNFPSILQIFFGFASIFTLSASILVVNDIIDIETDKINAPDRPIPSNLISPTEAKIFSILLLLAGLALGYYLSISAFGCVLLLFIVGYLYNRYFKKQGLIGNLMVSFSVGMTFIYGGITVGLPFNKAVIFFGIIAALIDLGEEIAADAMDIEGDLLINSKSLAIKFGGSNAIIISSAIFGTVILLSFIPFIFSWFSALYLFPIFVMDSVIGYSTIKLLKSNDQEGRKYIRLLYLGSTAGIVIFLIMQFINI